MQGSFSEKTTFYCDFTEEEFRALCWIVTKTVDENPEEYRVGTTFFADLANSLERLLNSSGKGIRENLPF